MSNPGRTFPRRYGCGEIDARVEEGDRDARCRRSPGTPALGRWPLVGAERLRLEQPVRHGGRERRPNREDADDLGHLLEQRDRSRVERRGEAVEDPLVAVLGLHGDAVDRERRQYLLLSGAGL